MAITAVDALQLARTDLTPRLSAIGSLDWDRPTPCTEWDVRQLVNHVVGLHHRVARLLRGGSREEYVETREDDWIGTSHIEAWKHAVSVLDEALSDADDLDTTVAYRVPMTARALVGLTAFDTAVHTWDLSRAVGGDERLDSDLTQYAIDVMLWLRSEPDLTVLFGPTVVDSPSGGSVQERLLRLAGRTP